MFSLYFFFLYWYFILEKKNLPQLGLDVNYCFAHECMYCKTETLKLKGCLCLSCRFSLLPHSACEFGSCSHQSRLIFKLYVSGTVYWFLVFFFFFKEKENLVPPGASSVTRVQSSDLKLSNAGVKQTKMRFSSADHLFCFERSSQSLRRVCQHFYQYFKFYFHSCWSVFFCFVFFHHSMPASFVWLLKQFNKETQFLKCVLTLPDHRVSV